MARLAGAAPEQRPQVSGEQLDQRVQRVVVVDGLLLRRHCLEHSRQASRYGALRGGQESVGLGVAIGHLGHEGRASVEQPDVVAKVAEQKSQRVGGCILAQQALEAARSEGAHIDARVITRPGTKGVDHERFA